MALPAAEYTFCRELLLAAALVMVVVVVVVIVVVVLDEGTDDATITTGLRRGCGGNGWLGDNVRERGNVMPLPGGAKPGGSVIDLDDDDVDGTCLACKGVDPVVVVNAVVALNGLDCIK